MIDRRPHRRHIGRGRASWCATTAGASPSASSPPATGRCSACGATPAPCTWRCSTSARARSRVVTLHCPDARYPSVGALHPPAIRLERALRDLYRPRAGRPARPAALARSRLLGRAASARRRGADAAPSRAPYAFLPAEGEGLHQIPVGPVHAGIIEPGHFRFTANGETVVRLEQRLGYVHKGIEALMAGADARARPRGSPAAPPATARSPMRSPSRAPSKLRSTSRCRRARICLRALMAELERLANHFGDIGAICNDASFSHHARAVRHPARAHAARRRCLLRPPADDGPRRAGRRRGRSRRRRRRRASRALLDDIRRRFPAAGRALRQHRLAAGPHRHHRHPERRSWRGSSAPAAMSAAPPGRAFDARTRARAIRPTTSSTFDVPVLEAGDVNARVWIRIREVEQSLALIEQILAGCRPARSDAGDRRPQAGAAKAWRWSKASAATCWCGCGSTATAASRAATCATRPGSSGRCWKPRSRATSSPTSRSATNRSTAPIRDTISRTAACARSCSKACRAGR